MGWRAGGIAPFETRPKAASDAREEPIRLRARERLRKDTAVADASALRMLPQKVDVIWGNRHEDAT